MTAVFFAGIVAASENCVTKHCFGADSQAFQDRAVERLFRVVEGELYFVQSQHGYSGKSGGVSGLASRCGNVAALPHDYFL
jgi:hypothetical protein